MSTNRQIIWWPKVGDEIEIKYVSILGRLFGKKIQKVHGVKAQVKPACADSRDGAWYCLTHEKHMEHQIAKDIHITSGEHKLVWICNQHGPEFDPKWQEALK